jgi:1-deoxy-D-xylulose-5-phosphate reductoisomerase
VLNAADEVATAAFLEGRIGFPAIVETVAKVLQQRPARTIRSLGDVQAADAEARRAAEDCIAAVANSPSRGDNPF